MIPTKWFVDVWITDNYEELCNKLSKKYGSSTDFWQKELSLRPSVITYEDIEKTNYIICLLEDFDLNVIVHETVHISWHLQDKVNFDYVNDTELQAYYIEYIVEEILKMKNK